MKIFKRSFKTFPEKPVLEKTENGNHPALFDPLSSSNKKELPIRFQAIAHTLGASTQKYLEGHKKLTESQIKNIRTEEQKIKNRIEKRIINSQEKNARKAERAEALIQKIQNRFHEKKEEFNAEESLHDYYQVMGCCIAYRNDLEINTEIKGPFPETTYAVQKIITSSRDMQMIFLTSTTSDLPPIVCCRGTIPKSQKNMIDNLASSIIGNWSFEHAKQEIKEALEHLKEPAVVTGHSLGGALAQILAVDFYDKDSPLIKEVHHFNAPGVGKKAKAYKTLPEESRPKVFGYRHQNDLISLAGGSHLKGKNIIFSENLDNFDVSAGPAVRSWHKAHTLKNLISQQSKGETHLKLKNWRWALETGRKGLGGLFKIAVGNKIIAKERRIQAIETAFKNFQTHKKSGL